MEKVNGNIKMGRVEGELETKMAVEVVNFWLFPAMEIENSERNQIVEGKLAQEFDTDEYVLGLLVIYPVLVNLYLRINQE